MSDISEHVTKIYEHINFNSFFANYEQSIKCK